MTFLRFATCTLLASVTIAFGDFQSDVQRIVNSSILNKGTASVCIIDTATDETLVQINSEMPMIPASNQKLLTSGAALHILGSEFEFQTKLLLDEGNLIVIGDGDPTIGDTELHGVQEWSKENTMLDKELMPWVHAIKTAGVKEINTLFVDDSIFDQNFVHPAWPADQINNWYCAQVSGLNYHLNVVHFFPSPRRGTKASLGEIVPRMKWITFGNKTTSKAGKNYPSSFWVARLPNTNAMTARGNVNAVHIAPVKVAFHNPAIVFGNTLANALRRNNIVVSEVKQIPAETHSKGKVIFAHKTPLKLALQRSNTDSHNLYAESLLKRISAEATGQSGTFDDGARIIKRVIQQRLQCEENNYVISDGSGMSRENKISSNIMARWLASFDINDAAGEALLNSLATPGNGTLDNRFEHFDLGEANVHAKSGYLRGVCSLSGYITFGNRDPIVFSIIVNGVKGTVKGAKAMQEAIVAAAVNKYQNLKD